MVPMSVDVAQCGNMQASQWTSVKGGAKTNRKKLIKWYAVLQTNICAHGHFQKFSIKVYLL